MTESGPAGYSPTLSTDCAGTIAPGETKTCTITNDDQPPDDVEAPVVVCGSADASWHAANVSIGCTANDARSGVADPADAVFTLSTSVPEGIENGDAATGTRQICDVAGNCATAGPIGGNRIDRKKPTLVLPANITVEATSSTGATATFAAAAVRRGRPEPDRELQPGVRIRVHDRDRDGRAALRPTTSPTPPTARSA